MTHTEELIAALARAMHDGGYPGHHCQFPDDIERCKALFRPLRDDIVPKQVAALDPATRDKMLLGFAVEELEQALPEGWVYSLNRIKSGYSLQSWPNGLRGINAGPNGLRGTGTGPTPLAAVEAANREVRDD